MHQKKITFTFSMSDKYNMLHMNTLYFQPAGGALGLFSHVSSVCPAPLYKNLVAYTV